ncbi:hypothetical protein B0T25DRAFT_478684 [Lasiosphaeria hispida]|uniref:U6 small nuclear RNA (adenine-(43)-N(6))-methyltransferase n=1 Tax=Lasiosphaeria hispida TaxID=260671 RepID=A0AAJ0HI49_9PEZI|nr:hypothetical protein B0T25DRAFT_478684 [Lasiosphaeria hispida]
MATKKRKTPADEATPGPAAAPNTPGPKLRMQGSGRPHSGPPAVGASPLDADAYFRTLYASEPSFKRLRDLDGDFSFFLKKNGQLDFNDPAAVMQLTKTLLKVDFGLKLELPDDRLCPPVPNRHNYILWLKGLMDSTSYEQPGRKLCGLDIGTGASCIYPLLGTAQRPWRFIATDIDAKSLGYAKRNVELNGIEHQIRILERDAAGALIPLDDAGVQSIDFVMTNPPFYTSEREMLSSAAKKERPPHTACTGAPVEMVCEGGEVAYVGRILRESLVLRNRVQWYTVMFGKVTSLEAMVGELRANGIDNYAVTEFIQGNKTRRWAVGWSFGPMRPAEDVARGIKSSIWRKILPPTVKMELLTLSSGNAASPLIGRIVEVVGSLELMSWSWEMEKAKGVGRTSENVWSRAWRRKRLRELSAGGGEEGGRRHGLEECQLGFAVTVEVGRTETSVALHWLEGHDQGLFESLGGFLQGRLKDVKTVD